MAMDTATAITAIEGVITGNLAAANSAAGAHALAVGIVNAVVAMIGTAQVTVASGLANGGGPVTGLIPAGSIT